MIAAALIPMAALTALMRRGKSGLSLTIGSLCGAGAVIFFYASGRPFGINPVVAIALTLIIFLPATLGCAAGATLGWMLRKRDETGPM